MSVLNVPDSESVKFDEMGDVLGKESENSVEMPVDTVPELCHDNEEPFENTPKKTSENCEDSVILNKLSQLNLDKTEIGTVRGVARLILHLIPFYVSCRRISSGFRLGHSSCSFSSTLTNECLYQRTYHLFNYIEKYFENHVNFR